MRKKFLVVTAVALIVLMTASSVPAVAAGWENGIAMPAAVAETSAQTVPCAQTYESETLRLMNLQRAARSLQELKSSAALDSVAAVRAKEVSALFSHTRPNGSAPSSLLKQYGISFSLAGENLAYGYESPAALVSAWMLSPEHRNNILNAGFQYGSVGIYRSSRGTIYAVQLFYTP